MPQHKMMSESSQTDTQYEAELREMRKEVEETKYFFNRRAEGKTWIQIGAEYNISSAAAQKRHYLFRLWWHNFSNVHAKKYDRPYLEGKQPFSVEQELHIRVDAMARAFLCHDWGAALLEAEQEWAKVQPALEEEKNEEVEDKEWIEVVKDAEGYDAAEHEEWVVLAEKDLETA